MKTIHELVAERLENLLVSQDFADFYEGEFIPHIRADFDKESMKSACKRAVKHWCKRTAESLLK